MQQTHATLTCKIQQVGHAQQLFCGCKTHSSKQSLVPPAIMLILSLLCIISTSLQSVLLHSNAKQLLMLTLTAAAFKDSGPVFVCHYISYTLDTQDVTPSQADL